MDFTYDYKGLNIRMEVWKKDFIAVYDSAYGPLTYFRHIMAMCPWEYSEEWIKGEKFEEAGEYFVTLKAFLDQKPGFIEETKNQLKERLLPFKEELSGLGQKKAEMKKQFKAGQISEKNYSQICKLINKKKTNLIYIEADFQNELHDKYQIDLGGVEKLIFQS